MDIKDITSENYEQFKYVFWLDWSNKVKYIDLFKRGIISGDTLGLFFIKDAGAVCKLVNYYKDFKKIVIYDSDATISLLKDYDSIDAFNDPRVEYTEIGQDLPMKFDKIIMNPPYSLGNKVTEAVLSSLNNSGDCVCLMPLSQYKKKELYRHVDSFELADPKLFEDAVVQENLSICLLKKNIVNKYDWMELTLKSFDQRFIEYYKWNIEHNKGIAPVRKDYKTPDMFDRNLDFVDTGRCFDATSHGHFSGPNSFGYKYNFYLKDWTNKDWGNILCVIHFQSKDAKDNFRAFAYAGNYQNNLAARCLSGVKTNMASSEYYFAIPQIDWENIHINQKELWDKGDYDEAVLSEMGLKWQGDSIVEC